MILLQHGGLTLSQLEWLVSFSAYVPSAWCEAHVFTTMIVLLLMLPSTFVAPLLSGSIDWLSTIDYDHANLTSGFGSVHIEHDFQWEKFKTEKFPKTEAVLSAIGYATTAWFDYGTDTNDWGSSRYVAQAEAPNGTLVENVPMPYIDIHSITWDDVWDPAAEKLVLDNEEIRYSTLYTRQSHTQGGAIIFDPSNRKFPEAELSTPEVLSLTRKIGVIVDSNNQDTNKDCKQTMQEMGWSVDAKITVKPFLTGFNCWVLGTVNFTVGIKYFEKGEYVADRVVEARNGSSTLVGDTWSEYALYMLSDVMSTLPTVTRVNLASGNLTRYTEALVRHSYIAMRQALYPYRPSQSILTAHIPSPVLTARVDRIRVWIWLGVQLMVPVASLLLLYIEYASRPICIRKPLVNSTALALLLTDVREVLAKDKNGISNMSYVTDKDSKELGRLRLRVIETPEAGAVFALTLDEPTMLE